MERRHSAKRVEHKAAGGKPNRFEAEAFRSAPGREVTASDAYEADLFGHSLRVAGYPRKPEQQL